jgi:hypothetical protein
MEDASELVASPCPDADKDSTSHRAAGHCFRINAGMIKPWIFEAKLKNITVMKEWIRTDSEAIAGYRYDPAQKILRVLFTSGSIYDYAGATASLYRRLSRAMSKGTFFSRHIRGKLRFTRIL